MTQWRAALRGKHPSSHDYLCLGDPGIALDAVFSWIAAGFTVPVLRAMKNDCRCARWHFWMLPENGHHWTCGIFGASCDRLGRPHPLMVAGRGAAPATRHWPDLTAGCRETWRTMAAAVDAPHTGPQALALALQRLAPPSDGARQGALDSAEKTLIMEKAARRLESCRTSRHIGIPLVHQRLGPWQCFMLWQHVLCEMVPVAPYSLFYCEPAAQAELFYRPLNRRDSARLMAIALAATEDRAG